jgi:hypothetical protein
MYVLLSLMGLTYAIPALVQLILSVPTALFLSRHTVLCRLCSSSRLIQKSFAADKCVMGSLCIWQGGSVPSHLGIL